MRPILDRIVVEPLEDQQVRASGIVALGGKRGETAVSTVVAVGPGPIASDGSTVPTGVKVGDRVYFSPLALAEFALGGKKYGILRHHDILLVLDEGEK